MVVVKLPSLLAQQAGGQREFEVEAATVGEALRALPISDFLLDERGELRRLVNVYVDGEDARRAEAWIPRSRKPRRSESSPQSQAARARSEP